MSKGLLHCCNSWSVQNTSNSFLPFHVVSWLGISLGVDTLVTSVRPEVVKFTVPIHCIPNFNLAGIPHHGGLTDAPHIPVGFWSFWWTPLPFQWNLPAKFSLQPQKFCYSCIYTRTVPRMDQNRMAPECSDQNEH